MEEKKQAYEVRYKIWLENAEGKPLFGDGKWELLCAIEETGSLKNAIEKMGWGYRATWNKLQAIEKRLGFSIIQKTRGGTGGGGQTNLTAQGKKFVEIFRKIHIDSDAEFEKISDRFNLLMKKALSERK
jgi:molybdate transport system regulatory protein